MTTTEEVELRVDVTGSMPISEPLWLSAHVFLPPELSTTPTGIILCTPGGSLSKEYYSLSAPRADYHFASHMTRGGVVVIAMDHLGTGASSQPVENPDAITLTTMSAANVMAARELRERARQGILAPGLGPVPDVAFIGMGHSLGGFSTILQQGTDRPYDAIVVLGASNQYLEAVYRPHENEEALSPEQRRHWVQSIIEEHGNRFDEPYLRVDRSAQRHSWYWDDITPDVLAADPETVLPRMAAIDGVTPGFARSAAAAVDVPVFLGFGERDVSPDPRLEPSYYRSAPDITLFVLPRSGHLHNMASSRHLLWDRLLRWVGGVQARVAPRDLPQS